MHLDRFLIIAFFDELAEPRRRLLGIDFPLFPTFGFLYDETVVVEVGVQCL
jgi:hypothetical protein